MREIVKKPNYLVRYASMQELQMVYDTNLTAAGTHRQFYHYHLLKWTYHKQRNIFTWFLFQGNGQLEEIGWAYLGPSIMTQCKKCDDFPLTQVLDIAYSPYVQYHIMLPHPGNSNINDNLPVPTPLSYTTTVSSAHIANPAVADTGSYTTVILSRQREEQLTQYAPTDICSQPEMPEDAALRLPAPNEKKQYRKPIHKSPSAKLRYRLSSKNKRRLKKTPVRDTS